MPYRKLDRSAINMRPLAERANRVAIEQDHVAPGAEPGPLTADTTPAMDDMLGRVREARKNNRPVMVAFGAHTIKNGLAPVLMELVRNGWLTHLATNGAGVIHDWEFAWQGASSEDVAGYMKDGAFGHWEETGFHINLAINIGAYRGLGYGEAVGAMIHREGLEIPSVAELEEEVRRTTADQPAQAAAAADLLDVLHRFELPAGWLSVPHGWKRFSIQAAAFEAGVPFTGHPMFGHDIIYNHPMNHGSLLGRAAERDYLTFAESVSRLEGGVYLSLGSAVMSPMVFEKSMSMAQNLARQNGRPISNHFICVVDLARSTWDWRKGEPPEESPEYYLRYNKSFSRMGGTMRYVSMDNRDFLLHLWQGLNGG